MTWKRAGRILWWVGWRTGWYFIMYDSVHGRVGWGNLLRFLTWYCMLASLIVMAAAVYAYIKDRSSPDTQPPAVPPMLEFALANGFAIYLAYYGWFVTAVATLGWAVADFVRVRVEADLRQLAQQPPASQAAPTSPNDGRGVRWMHSARAFFDRSVN